MIFDRIERLILTAGVIAATVLLYGFIAETLYTFWCEPATAILPMFYYLSGD